MRVVHIGDMHLGPNARNADRRAAFEQILNRELSSGRQVAMWAIPGDLNHGRMTIEDRNWLADIMMSMAAVAPVVICYGNHDLPGDLDFLALLGTIYPIHVVSVPRVVRVEMVAGWSVSGKYPASIFVMPYPTKSGLVAAGVAQESIGETARAALDMVFLASAAEMAAAPGDPIRMVLGHVNVSGSMLSSGQPNIGREIEVDAALLQRFGPIYIGLNHIHKGQSIGGAHYPGSICRLDYGEVEPKRYLVVEYDAHRSLHEFVVHEELLDVAPMYHVEGELTVENGFVSGPLDRTDWTGCEVRVRYTYNAVEKDALDHTLPGKAFASAKVLKVEPIAMRSRVVRSPEVAAAVTLDDKVRAYVEQSGIEWTPGLDAKLALVQKVWTDDAALADVVRKELSGVVPGGPATVSGGPLQVPHDRAAVPDTVTEGAL